MHSRLQNSTVKASFDALKYRTSHGYYNFFWLLRHHGFQHERMTSGTLTPERLADVDLLFLNVTEDLYPPYTDAEVEAVKDFVESGGSLWVIVDHTNAYHNAEMTEPMVAPYGISLPYEAVCDNPPNTFKMHHWVLISRFAEHSITKGLHQLGVFGGAPIEGPGCMANTSEEGFGDHWDPSNGISFWGNQEQDPDEPSRVISVINALDFGEGKVVVVGDQNIFGNAYWGFGDNRRAMLNIAQWLGGFDDEPPWRDLPVPLPIVAIDGRVDGIAVGSVFQGFHDFYEHLSRQSWFAVDVLLREPPETPRILILLEPSETTANEDRASVASVLDAGGAVVLLSDPMAPTKGAVEVLDRHWPDLAFEGDNGERLDLLHDPKARDQVGTMNRGRLRGALGEQEIDPQRELPRFSIPDAELVAWLDNGEDKSPFIVRRDRLLVILHPSVLKTTELEIGVEERLVRYLALLIEAQSP